jgi:hypothetical protein
MRLNSEVSTSFCILHLCYHYDTTLHYRVITIHLCLIIGYDIGDEVGVVSGLLFEFPADRNMKDLLVIAQQSWHKSHRNASRVQIVRQNALNGPI